MKQLRIESELELQSLHSMLASVLGDYSLRHRALGQGTAWLMVDPC